MSDSHSPTVRRRRLGMELRRLREASALMIEDVARHLECSMSRVSRIETGKSVARIRDVRDMLDLYKVTDEGQREQLLTLAKEAQQRGWWTEYEAVLSAGLDTYVGLEASAASIRSFQTHLVPGLLQTEEYSRALIRVGAAGREPGQHRPDDLPAQAPAGDARRVGLPGDVGRPRRGGAAAADRRHLGDAGPARPAAGGRRAAERHDPGAAVLPRRPRRASTAPSRSSASPTRPTSTSSTSTVLPGTSSSRSRGTSAGTRRGSTTCERPHSRPTSRPSSSPPRRTSSRMRPRTRGDDPFPSTEEARDEWSPRADAFRLAQEQP